MFQSSSDLSRELAAISDRFSNLSELLLSAARQLHAPGSPPSDDLIDAVTACRHDFLALRDHTADLAASLHVGSPSDDLTSLQDVTDLLDQVAEAELHQSRSEGLRTQALWVLDRVLAISHASDPNFAPLHDCHESAAALRETVASGLWKNLPGEAEHLAEGEHAFANLLTLIEHREELSDDQWADLHEKVGTAFGKPLAAAAARAKLVSPRHHPDEEVVSPHEGVSAFHHAVTAGHDVTH